MILGCIMSFPVTCSKKLNITVYLSLSCIKSYNNCRFFFSLFKNRNVIWAFNFEVELGSEVNVGQRLTGLVGYVGMWCIPSLKCITRKIIVSMVAARYGICKICCQKSSICRILCVLLPFCFLFVFLVDVPFILFLSVETKSFQPKTFIWLMAISCKDVPYFILSWFW